MKAEQNSENIQYEILKELASRAKYTGFAYIPLFVIIEFSKGKLFGSLNFFISGLVLLLALSSLRVVLSSKLTFENQNIWKRYFYGSILASSLFWGAFSFYSIHNLGINTFTLLIMFSTGGIAAGSSSSLGFSLNLLRSNLVLLLIPTITALAVSSSLGTNSMALMVLFFFTVLFAQAKITFKDFSSILKKNILIQTKNQELLISKEKALEAIRTKSLFLANMSHEIRTPMNGILACTDFLKEKVHDSEGHKYLRTIKHCGDGLLVLINDILDFSKLESGRIHYENRSFDLHEIIHDVTDLLSSTAVESKITLTYQIEESVPRGIRSDDTRVRQLLINLVGNALKFTTDRVELHVDYIGMENDLHIIQFSIIDNGVGIAEEDVTKLFRNFSQVDSSTTRKFGGTGLGLAICKGIVDGMGGEIWGESTLGEGSTFRFTLIVNEATDLIFDNNETIQKSEVVKTSSLNILVAEDNKVNQMVMKKSLEKLGYFTVDIVNDGAEALKAVQSKQYDVILMDQHMPNMDGVEATIRIREFASPDLKIIAVTASAFQEDRERCLAVGMNDFLAKPIQTKQLEDALASCVSELKKTA